MAKFLLRLFVFGLINILVIKGLYLDQLNNPKNTKTLIQQVYSEENFKYWSREDGRLYCRLLSDDDYSKIYNQLDKYIHKRTNVIYFQNIDLISCKDFIITIAREFHKRDLEIAFNIETEFEKDKVYPENFNKFKPDYYKTKLKDFSSINEWVDYLVLDSGTKYMTSTERREVLGVLRNLFPRPSIGFRFTKAMNLDPTLSNNIRNNKLNSEFLPIDDDGDFIITQFSVKNFRRTSIIMEDEEKERIGINGIFIN